MQKRRKISLIIIYSPIVFVIISMFFVSFLLQRSVDIGYLLLITIILCFFVYLVAKKIYDSIDKYARDLDKKRKQLKEKNKLLKQMLYKDLLTKLPNKKALFEDIEKMKTPKIILFDIDSFGDINEYYGSEVGDFILLHVRDFLLQFAKKFDAKVYRVGADEFALLEDESLDIEKYEELLEELVFELKAKEIEIPSLNQSIQIHVTIGASLESSKTFAKAHIALAHAKQTQKDFAFYMQSLDTKEAYAKQVKWSNLIKEAITKDEIIPYFQPIFDADGKLVKYECLARIVSEDKAISPIIFMETSKNVRQYAKIAKVLIEKSFSKISKTDKQISINLLARDMSDSDVSNYIVDKIKEYGVAKQVVLEILEDENIEKLERAKSFLDRVRRMGVKIAIDDFGTGYSNFSYLLKLRPDYIKIDGSLIKHIDTDDNSIAIVSAILAFSKKLGIKTIAEYVHSKEVYEKCKELGIDEFQGFYLGEPTSSLVDISSL